MRKQIGAKNMITVSTIANASKGELLCITYEMLLEQIQAAKETIGDERKKHLHKAVDTIKMLVEDLNFEFDIAKDLFRIYVYVQGILIKATSDTPLDEAYKLIEKLYIGFVEAGKSEVQTKPCMENTEVVYAGFTYGPDDLKELSISEPNRGFKA